MAWGLADCPAAAAAGRHALPHRDRDAELLAAAISSLTLNLRCPLPLRRIVMFGIVLFAGHGRTRQPSSSSVAKTVLLLPLIFLLPLWWGRDLGS